MAEFDPKQLLDEILEATKDELGDSWKKYEILAEIEFTKLANEMNTTKLLYIQGFIPEDRAIDMLEIQTNGILSWFEAFKGLAKLETEKTINTIFGVIQAYIQRVFGFVIFPDGR